MQQRVLSSYKERTDAMEAYEEADEEQDSFRQQVALEAEEVDLHKQMALHSNNDLEKQRSEHAAHVEKAEKKIAERQESYRAALYANEKKKQALSHVVSTAKKKKAALQRVEVTDQHFKTCAHQLQFGDDDAEERGPQKSWFNFSFSSSNKENAAALSPQAIETVKTHISQEEAQKNLAKRFEELESNPNTSNGVADSGDSPDGAPLAGKETNIDGPGKDHVDSPRARVGVAATRRVVSPKKKKKQSNSVPVVGKQKVCRPGCMSTNTLMLTIVLTIISLVTSSLHQRLRRVVKRLQ